MANVVSTTTTLSPAMQRYYDKLFLERAQDMQKFSFLAIPKTVPKNSGRIVYFTLLNQLTANSTAITEGTPVTSISTSASNVIATASEYGAYEQITTLYELTTIDQGLKEHVEMMGQNAGESMNIVLGRVLNATAGITQLCANSVQVSAIASTDTMSVSGIRTAVMYLKKAKAPKWENGNYRAVMHPDAIYQLQGDSAAGNWINVNMYNSGQNAEMIKKGVIGTLYGVDIVETNIAFSSSAATADSGTSASGRTSFFAGKGAVAEVNVGSSGGAHVIYKKPGDSDTSNPLNLYSTLGWKVDAYAAKVLNASWLIQYVSYALPGNASA